MPVKLLRLGYTESTLLFIYWLHMYTNLNSPEIIELKNIKIKWLYTTSGYYDITQSGHYFNVIHNETDPVIYTKYMAIIYNFIKDADICKLFMEITDIDEIIETFMKLINSKQNKDISQEMVFNFIANKRILIISPFAELIKTQYDTGNCKIIYPNTPTITTINIYTFPYTFFNGGPHNNILETSDYVFNDIIKTIKDEYDSVLISCGAYSCLIAKQFYDIGKNVCTIGGELQTFFGIKNGRTLFPNTNQEYWIIDIPEKYKPIDYNKIENGCYW